jgi:cardiolipin synthase
MIRRYRLRSLLLLVLTLVLIVTSLTVPVLTGRTDVYAGTDMLSTFPDDAHIEACRLIAGAGTSVLFTIYDLTDPRICDVLVSAAARDVDVRVLVDPQERVKLADMKSIIADLTRSGVAVRNANTAYRITHAKYMVIDGSTAYISGNNFTYADSKKNRAFAVTTTDAKVVADLTAVFWADWKRQPLSADKLTSDRVLLSPVNAGAKMMGLIQDATTSIVVAVQYLQNDAVNQALADAVLRGVHVRCITDGTYVDSRSSAFAANLLIGGDRVRVAMDPYYHVKMMLVDDTRMFVGSQNFSAPPLTDNNPLQQQREVGLIVTDPTLIAKARAVFEFDWARAVAP